MSDPNQPPPYPGPEQPPGYGYPQYPPAYGQPQYGHPQYPPPYGYPQYGPPAFPYADWGLRLAAYLLDGVIILPIYLVAVVGVFLSGSGEDAGTGAQVVGIAMIVAGYAGALGFAIWNQIVRQGRTGSSLGKEWMGIMLVSERTGQPIGGWMVLGRHFVHVLDALPCYVGYFWPLWDPKKQTFADKILDTVVIRPRSPGQAPAPPPAYPAV